MNGETTPVPFHGTHYRHIPELHDWTSKHSEAPIEPGLPIVDAHHHLWDDDRGVYLLDEFVDEFSGHNIVATIYAQYRAMYRADGDPDMQPVGEVEFVNGLAAASASNRYGPVRVAEGIIGYANMLLGDNARPVLEALVAAGNGRLSGIRHGATWDDGAAAHGRSFPPRGLFLDAKFQSAFAQLAPLGLSFDAWLFFHQLPDLAPLLARFGSTNVILDHCGGILGIDPHNDRKAVFDHWRTNLKGLAEFPNLNVKIGGLGMLYCGWDHHFQKAPPTSEQIASDWRPYVETCIEIFGTERCLFESNFPMDKQTCGYGVLWNAFKRITQGYSASEKAALYHDNAVRLYKLPRQTVVSEV